MVSLSFGRLRRTLRAALEARDAGHLEEALRLLRSAREPGRRDPRPLLQEALVLAEAGRIDEAEAVLEEAHGLGRDAAVVQLFRGFVLLDGGKPAEAAGAFDGARALEPENHLASSGAALARWEEGRIAEAARELLEVPFVHAASFEARLLLRVERFVLERARRRGEHPPLYDPWEEVEEERGGVPGLDRFLRAWRRRRATRFMGRAAACGAAGDATGELEWIERALLLLPRDEAFLMLRDRARRRALKAARRSLRKERKGDPALLLEAGTLSVLCGETEEGVRLLGEWHEAFRKGEGGASDAWRIEWGLALAAQGLSALGRHAEAEALLSELCGLNTLDAHPRFLLGRCRLAAGDAAGARRAFKEALDFEPGLARRRLRVLAREEGW